MTSPPSAAPDTQSVEPTPDVEATAPPPAEPPPAEVEPPLELTSVTVDMAGVDLSDMLSVGQRIETTTADIYLTAGDPGLVLIDTTMKLRDRVRRVEQLPLTMFIKVIPAEAASIISSFTSEGKSQNE